MPDFSVKFTPNNPDPNARYQFLQVYSYGEFGWNLDYGDGAVDPPFYSDRSMDMATIHFQDGPKPGTFLGMFYYDTDFHYVLAVVALSGDQKGRVLGLLRWG